MKNLNQTVFAIACAFALQFIQILPGAAQTFDSTFASPTVTRKGITGTIRKAAKDKIYVAGDFNYYGSTMIGKLVRLTPNGLLDTSFKPDLPVDGDILKLEILPNGNLLVIFRHPVANLNELYVLAVDGRRMATIGGDGNNIADVLPLPDNRFLLARGLFEGIHRYSKNFALDSTFQCYVNGSVSDLKLQGSNILVSGSFSSVSRDPWSLPQYEANNIARLNSNGVPDMSFNASQPESFGSVKGMHVQPDGRIILLNNYDQYGQASPPMRLNANGSVDTGFNFADPSSTIEDANYLNGKITISTKSKTFRVNDDGSIDQSFQSIGYAPGNVPMAVLPDASVVLGNYANSLYGFVKFSSTGVLNSTYNPQLMRNGIIYCMDRTAASIYIGGEFERVGNHFTKNVARINPNGTVLTKFKVTEDYGPVWNIEGFSNARCLIQTENDIHRIDHDGKPDLSFSFNPFVDGPIRKMIVQNDGKVLVVVPPKIFRLNNNGSPDNAFNTVVAGVESPYGGTIWLHHVSGKIMYAGESAQTVHRGPINLKRLNSDGSIDATFSTPEGYVQNYHRTFDLTILDNMEVVFTSGVRRVSDNEFFNEMKLNADGSVNQTFLDNYFLDPDFPQSIETLHRFGHRVIMSANYFYGESAIHHTIFEDGTTDPTFHFPFGSQIYWLDRLYSDNDRELFVLGQTRIGTSPRYYQIVKILYPEETTAARVPLEDAREVAIETPDISFYPNPVKEMMHIQAPSNALVNIYGFSGKREISKTIHSGESDINVNDLKPGRYVVKIFVDGKTFTKHFVKE